MNKWLKREEIMQQLNIGRTALYTAYRLGTIEKKELTPRCVRWRIAEKQTEE